MYNSSASAIAQALIQAKKMGGQPGEPGLESPFGQRLLENAGIAAGGYGVGNLGANVANALAPRVGETMQGLGEAGYVRNPFGAPKGYADLEYTTSLPVKAYTEPGVPFYDEIKGLNPGHALYNAKQNWPGLDVQPTGLSGESANKAQILIDAISQKYKEYRSLMQDMK